MSIGGPWDSVALRGAREIAGKRLKSVTGYTVAKRNTTLKLINELSKPKRNKYGAKKVELDGYTFDSKKEAQYYANLKAQKKAGMIDRFEVHPQYELVVNGELIAKYKADFIVWPTQRAARVFDIKSPPTAKKRDFVLIRKLMRAIHGIDVEVVY